MPTATVAKKTIRDIAIAGKRVLIRVDFNVPQDAAGAITDDARIRESLPTIQHALQQNAKVILMSHLGRPKGQRKPELTLAPVAKRLGELLKRPVTLAPDCVGSAVEAAVAGLKPGDVLLLENLRFHHEEEANDDGFVKQLAKLGDVYVNDAFGTAHRAHASTEGVAHHLPAVAGFLIEKEIQYFEQILNHPQRPLFAILGGAKVSDKIGVIKNLLDRVDGILIGGAMSYTFLKAQGRPVGNSRVEADKVDVAKELLALAGTKLQLPVDFVVTTSLKQATDAKVVSAIPDGWESADIGPQTREIYKQVLERAKMVVWNGPVGAFEFKPFHEGTLALAKFLNDRSSQTTTVIGGGDTGAALTLLGVADHMAHISTGGGASLEYLEGQALPGIAILQDK